jgi:hypothetical protein
MGEYEDPGDGQDFDDENNQKELALIISVIKDQCVHVYGDPENGVKLDQLISDAQEFYNVNPKGWQKLLQETKQNLSLEDESQIIEDILRKALTVATTELM